MGISLKTAERLIDICRARGVIGGSCLSLGKQDMACTLGQLMGGMAKRGMVQWDGQNAVVSPRQKAIVDEFTNAGRLLSFKPHDAGQGFISDDFFFRFIGFEKACSVDYSDFEKADAVFDLNDVGLSAAVGTFDFVYDGGTLEHVFHIPNVMRNIFETLNVGGIVLHHSPTNNNVDHGFYQFSPTFFNDYYRTNEFDDIAIRVGRLGPEGFASGADYYPGMLDAAMQKLDNAVYTTECIAKKTAASTWNRTPQQGFYKNIWGGPPPSA